MSFDVCTYTVLTVHTCRGLSNWHTIIPNYITTAPANYQIHKSKTPNKHRDASPSYHQRDSIEIRKHVCRYYVCIVCTYKYCIYPKKEMYGDGTHLSVQEIASRYPWGVTVYDIDRDKPVGELEPWGQLFLVPRSFIEWHLGSDLWVHNEWMNEWMNEWIKWNKRFFFFFPRLRKSDRKLMMCFTNTQPTWGA